MLCATFIRRGKTSEQLYIEYKTLIIDQILSGYLDIIISVRYGGWMTTLFLGLMPQQYVTIIMHVNNVHEVLFG